MTRSRPTQTRRRSGRSWIFKYFQRGNWILLLATLYAWMWSPHSWIYYVGSYWAIGLAKGAFDVMLVTGDPASPAFGVFPNGGLEDPAMMYRPNLWNERDPWRQRPQGWFTGSYTELMPPEERLSLRAPFWWSHYFPRWGSGPNMSGPATFRNLQLPCWLVTLFIVALCVLNFLLDRPLPAHLCVTCHYNLTGNTSGICPECGTAITQENVRPDGVPQGPRENRPAVDRQ